MQSYDLFMLGILIAAIAWGAWKGFAWQVASLASLVLSYLVAFQFRNPLSAVLNMQPPWNIFLAMLILFAGTSGGVWIGFNFVSNLIDKVKLNEFDRQLGALFGFVKGVLLCVLITLFAVTLLDEQRRQAICNSRSGYYIALLLIKAEALMPQEVQQVLAPYFNGVTPPGYPTPTGYAADPAQPAWPGPSYNPQGSYPGNAPQYPYDPRYSEQPTAPSFFSEQGRDDVRR